MLCEPAYEAPNYGSVTCTDGNNLGSQCTFACDDGYKLIGEHKSTCDLIWEGFWSVAEWDNSSPHYCIRKSLLCLRKYTIYTHTGCYKRGGAVFSGQVIFQHFKSVK